MNDSFPPRPVHGTEIRLVADAFASVIEGRTAVYLSAPLTSGERWMKWRAKFGRVADEADTGYHDERCREVVKPNRERAAAVAHSLRVQLARIVIDPTALEDLPEWDQVDYYSLWARVIERYVAMVVFVDGWQYSKGCVLEFLTAVESEVVTLDQRQQPLPLQEGAQLIKSAMQDLQAQGLSTAFHEAVLRELT